MKYVALGFAILSLAPQIIGQQALHSFGNNLGFAADSIERQDPPGASSDAWASDIHLKGNVLIRACCLGKGLAENQPKQAIFMRGDEALYHSDKNEIEFRGNMRVSFQNYPK